MRCLAAVLLIVAERGEAPPGNAAGLPPPVVPRGCGVNIHFTEPAPGEMGRFAEAGFRLVEQQSSIDRWGPTNPTRQRGRDPSLARRVGVTRPGLGVMATSFLTRQSKVDGPLARIDFAWGAVERAEGAYDFAWSTIWPGPGRGRCSSSNYAHRRCDGGRPPRAPRAGRLLADPAGTG
ncbi:MAG TPA: hypothetical protein VF590_21465 [Isosphaeraceae bacterium]